MMIRRQKIKQSLKALILILSSGSFLAAFSAVLAMPMYSGPQYKSQEANQEANQRPNSSKTLITPAPLVEDLAKDTTITIIRALDKITARITEVELPEGREIRFGALAIRARTCKSNPPEEQPETFAFLEIDDVKKDNERVRLFNGWMLASSPALNPLEHPVYDVWVISCKTVSADEASPKE